MRRQRKLLGAGFLVKPPERFLGYLHLEQLDRRAGCRRGRSLHAWRHEVFAVHIKHIPLTGQDRKRYGLTMNLSADYAFFYLEGRNDKHLRCDIDTESIAKEVIAGQGTVHELVHKAVSDAAAGMRVDRKKRAWLEEYDDDIKEAGGDGEEAYRHYMAGKIDELTHHLEGEVVEDMLEAAGGDEEDDEEEEEDDDGDEDGPEEAEDD
jgi:hypothetical protein